MQRLHLIVIAAVVFRIVIFAAPVPTTAVLWISDACALFALASLLIVDKLAFSIIRRFKNSGVRAILLDPIYKCMTGDENSAEDMGKFCGYLGYIGAELGASLIYSHHHSKGADNKGYRSFEKSSGSGVFSRDPDAILDLTELKLEEAMKDRFMEYCPRPCLLISSCDRKIRKIRCDQPH